MAYTTPATFTSGNVLTAAQLNTNLRDNVAWLASDSPTCRAYKAGAFSHNSSGNELAITLDTERFDSAAVHSTASLTSRMTAPTGGGGKYLIGSTTSFAVSAAGGYRQIRFKVGGATYIGYDTREPSASHASESTAVTVYNLNAGDYVEMYGVQDSGGTLAMGGFPGVGPEFYVFWFRT